MSSHLVQLVIGSGVWTRTRTLMPCTTLVPTPELIARDSTWLHLFLTSLRYRLDFDHLGIRTLISVISRAFASCYSGHSWPPVSNTWTGELHGRLIIRTTHSWLMVMQLSRHQNNIIVCIYVLWFVSKKPHNRLRKLSKSTLCGFILQKLHFIFWPQSNVLIDRMLSWLGQQIPEFGNRVLVLWYVRLLSLLYRTGYTCFNSASSKESNLRVTMAA